MAGAAAAPTEPGQLGARGSRREAGSAARPLDIRALDPLPRGHAAEPNGHSPGTPLSNGNSLRTRSREQSPTTYHDAVEDSGIEYVDDDNSSDSGSVASDQATEEGVPGAAETASHPLHGLLESKIAELESSTLGKLDEEAKRIAKARKRQVRDFRALVDATDRSPDEKLRILNGKFMQQLTETRALERELMAIRKKCEQLHKEKDTVVCDLVKEQSMKQKLESLCRELQRQNKMVQEDSKRVASDEQSKRQELSTKFHNTIKEITSKLEDQGDERLRQLKENEMLREKLKHFTQQYDLREQHFAHQLRTKALEQQLVEAKLKQQQELGAQEETKVRMYTEQINALLKTEAELRGQLAMYGDKFEQFQDTLTKSNEVFATFKKEMEKMSKTIKKLEKENAGLREKGQKSDLAVVEIAEEREKWKKQAETLRAQKEKLESLCRSLQMERKNALASSNSKPQTAATAPAGKAAATAGESSS